MTGSEFVSIATFASAAEAEFAASLLRDYGLDSFVDGTNANMTLSHVGNALGGVRLCVRVADAEQADDILRAATRDSTQSKPWYCGSCQEGVDAGFEVCWCCGRDRSEVEMPRPRKPIRTPSNVSQVPQSNFVASSLSFSDRVNPYRSPEADSMTLTQKPRLVKPEVEETLERAWRASVLGFVLFPVLTNLYSMCLLVTVAGSADHLSRRGRRRFYGAFALNILSALVWSAFAAMR